MKPRSTTISVFSLLLAIFERESQAYIFGDQFPFLSRQHQQHALRLVKPKASNEWGIPYSDDLPPLVNRIVKPIPRSLPNGGRVTMMGSGPGDPDLLTVSAYKLLTQADSNTLVIVDRLVSPEILDLIQCDYKVARKLPGCAELAQEEIYWWAYQALNQGKHVIRLKIGDPFVFGRGGEEVLCFRRFGVDPIVIPVSVLCFIFQLHALSNVAYVPRIIVPGRFCCIFCSFARKYTRDAPRRCESGGNVYRLR